MKTLPVNPERLVNRRFIPKNIDLCDWDQIEKLYKNLLERDIGTPQQLERFIFDASELSSALQEEFARIQLATSVNTIDENAKALFRHFNEKILMNSEPLTKALDDRILQSPAFSRLDDARYGQLKKLLEMNRRLFREENIPLTIQDSQLGEQYSAITGGMSAEFEGKKLNLAQISNFLKEPDRDLREKAWRTISDCKRQYRERINTIYDELIRLRFQIARNAGFDSFRDYKHLQYRRFDYTPDDCYRFHETIEKYAVPVLKMLRDYRCSSLGLDKLRPWDTAVDMQNKPPLKPASTQDELVKICAQIMNDIYPDLGDTLRRLNSHGNLDLMTRQNKAVVGFNMPLAETGVSFIFMNATGTHDDLTVLLHEAGHAVETAACADDPILEYRHTPQEWGECASQSMELLGLDHLDVVYPDPESRKRCALDKFEDIFVSLVTSARVDAFQHWVYTHPDHTSAQRDEYWMSLLDRFPDGLDFSGLEDRREYSYQSIPHLFIVPFYYIEYGITQISALQVYRMVKKRGHAFIQQWLETMKWGGSKSIPELYERSGLKFIFHGDEAGEVIRYADMVVKSLMSWFNEHDPSFEASILPIEQ